MLILGSLYIVSFPFFASAGQKVASYYEQPGYEARQKVVWARDYIVHTLCHYCGMVATAASKNVSKHLEAA